MKRETIGQLLTIGVLAGLAGGVAEVAWISLYAAVSGTDAAAVARGITDTVGLAGSSPAAAGLAIHMAIAATLGMLVAAGLAPLRLDGARLYGALTWVLAVVWAVNFMIVLPLINPAFVEIVPLGVSFVSKVVFGLATAMCLQFTGRAARARATA
ncbi:MAG: hypothetical protein E6G97_17505 [Alphaproteobacteria bacterium]|nr:MAG: hypothetical protein E6G97_17505 [Alphaproteobacteria bacterium]